MTAAERTSLKDVRIRTFPGSLSWDRKIGETFATLHNSWPFLVRCCLLGMKRTQAGGWLWWEDLSISKLEFKRLMCFKHSLRSESSRKSWAGSGILKGRHEMGCCCCLLKQFLCQQEEKEEKKMGRALGHLTPGFRAGKQELKFWFSKNAFESNLTFFCCFSIPSFELASVLRLIFLLILGWNIVNPSRIGSSGERGCRQQKNKKQRMVHLGWCDDAAPDSSSLLFQDNWFSSYRINFPDSSTVHMIWIQLRKRHHREFSSKIRGGEFRVRLNMTFFAHLWNIRCMKFWLKSNGRDNIWWRNQKGNHHLGRVFYFFIEAQKLMKFNAN